MVVMGYDLDRGERTQGLRNNSFLTKTIGGFLTYWHGYVLLSNYYLLKVQPLAQKMSRYQSSGSMGWSSLLSWQNPVEAYS